MCLHTVSRRGDRAFVKITVVLRALRSSSFALELLISKGLEIDTRQVSFLTLIVIFSKSFNVFSDYTEKIIH